MIHKICRIDVLPLVVLHVGDDLAKPEEARVAVDEDAIVR